MESRTARTDRSPLARPAARRRVPPARGRRRHPDHSADARTREHSADAALPERDGRRTQERTGGELEQQRPTASPGVGKLIGLVSFPDCPRFVPGNWKFWLRGPATGGTCSLWTRGGVRAPVGSGSTGSDRRLGGRCIQVRRIPIDIGVPNDRAALLFGEFPEVPILGCLGPTIVEPFPSHSIRVIDSECILVDSRVARRHD